MNPILRKIVVFGLLFVPVFLAFMALYVWIYPAYHSFATGTSNLVTKHMSPPTYLKVSKGRDGGWVARVFTAEKGFERMRSWREATAHLIYLSMILLPALLLATPAPILARLRMLAYALPLIFAGHVLSLVLLTRATYCLQENPGNFSCLLALRFTYSSGQLFAGIFWVLLTWRYWFSALVASPHGEPDTGRG